MVFIDFRIGRVAYSSSVAWSKGVAIILDSQLGCHGAAGTVLCAVLLFSVFPCLPSFPCACGLQRLKIKRVHFASSVSSLCTWVLTNPNAT